MCHPIDLASSLNSCLFMLIPYLRIKPIPPCLPVILDERDPFPYLRGRVCANDGIFVLVSCSCFLFSFVLFINMYVSPLSLYVFKSILFLCFYKKMWFIIVFIFVLSICLCIVRVIDRITILNGDLVAETCSLAVSMLNGWWEVWCRLLCAVCMCVLCVW